MNSEHPSLLHFSYHKCLTVFFRSVLTRALARPGRGADYVHLNSRIERLPAAMGRHRLVSLNNHYVAPATLGDFRASRFVRDPRDLLVSGYHYHKRGAEPWCLVKDPTPADWSVVNGQLPIGLPAGESFASYLQKCSVEEGLLAELDFRRAHFDSMAQWPDDDERILLARYEDVLGNEQQVYRQIFHHYGLSWPRRAVGTMWAGRLSAGSRANRTAHIRDPQPRQWEALLDSGVLAEFRSRHPDILAKYRYE